jgi:hypothetical protein
MADVDEMKRAVLKVHAGALVRTWLSNPKKFFIGTRDALGGLIFLSDNQESPSEAWADAYAKLPADVEMGNTSYSHCPTCGQKIISGQFLCGHKLPADASPSEPQEQECRYSPSGKHVIPHHTVCKYCEEEIPKTSPAAPTAAGSEEPKRVYCGKPIEMQEVGYIHVSREDGFNCPNKFPEVAPVTSQAPAPKRPETVYASEFNRDDEVFDPHDAAAYMDYLEGLPTAQSVVDYLYANLREDGPFTHKDIQRVVKILEANHE